VIGVILQARMGSTRLPGKVLMKINNNSSIEFQINRINQAKRVDKIILATTDGTLDDPVEELCRLNDILIYRGSENDVLDRYYRCAKIHDLSTIVRLTADCPLVDPVVIDAAINTFQKNKLDYCSNTVPPESSQWPDGSDVEVFSFNALEKAFFEATTKEDREHVTFYFWRNNSKKFKTHQISNNKDWSKYRFTIDYPEDYEAVKLIVKEFYKDNKIDFTTEDIVNLLEQRSDITSLNSQFSFGEGWKQ
jgi:spore coat polysaccharide biosynthesis protein SpsF